MGIITYCLYSAFLSRSTIDNHEFTIKYPRVLVVVELQEVMESNFEFCVLSVGGHKTSPLVTG